MPEMGNQAQAVECLADIRKRGGASSGIMVFDSEQRDTTTAHAAHDPLIARDSGERDSKRVPALHSHKKLATERLVRGV